MHQQKPPGNPRECFKCLFYILNTILLICSLDLLGSCVMLMFIASRFGAVPLAVTDTDNPLYSIVIVSAKIAGILSGIAGLFTFLLSLLGCCGTLNRKPGWLNTYRVGSWVLILIAGFSGSVSAYMLEKVNVELEDRLMVAMQRYDGEATFNTFFIDYNQVMMGCCGIKGKDDFQRSAWFQAGHAGVPMSCCQLINEEKVKNFGNPVKTLTQYDLFDPTCHIDPIGKTHTTQPCLERIRTSLKMPLFMGLWGAGLIIIILIVMAYIARQIATAYSGMD